METSAITSLEICRVTPPPDSPASSSHFSLPLTFFDTLWLKFPPNERIFFYRLPTAAATSSASEFQATVVPRLKRSLSLALLHFLPLAGNLTWPADADFPFILYSPGDGVAVTIAESTSADHDFDLLSGDGPRGAILSRPYVPNLAVSGLKAAVLALQITLFPEKGFCIGVASHHAVLDGKSSAMFLKAWAHISSKGWCDVGDGSLPEELTPCFDRTVVKDPDGIASEDVKTWMAICSGDDNPRSLEFMQQAVPTTASESCKVRGTFKLSRQAIQKIKENVTRQLESNENKQPEIKPNNLSTFVITYAYILVSLAKAKRGLKDDKKAFFGIMVDCRSRLEPPLPSTYFGNCVLAFADELTIGDLVHKTGIASAARKLVKMIKKLDKGVLVDAKGKLGRMFREVTTRLEDGLIGVSVAGSPRLGVYGANFGYGRPEKVEITSIDRSSAVSMAESGDGCGGVEVGLVMEKTEMEEFSSAFFNGIKLI